MFTKYVKENEIQMSIEFNNLCGFFSLGNQSLSAPFLTKTFYENKGVDLFDYLVYFTKFIKQLKENKGIILDMVSDRDENYANGSLLMSLKDLITYASSFSLDEVQKAVITNIRNQYNL